MSRKFADGSRVRVIADVKSLNNVGIVTYAEDFAKGLEGVVRTYDGSNLPYGIEIDGYGLWWFEARQLEAVKVQKPKVARPTKVKPKVAKPAKVKPVKVGLASLADAIALYPQTRKVLVHLERHGSISPLEAFGVYRITRLAARIKEIRNAGFKVVTNMKTDPTGTKYAEYRLSHV